MAASKFAEPLALPLEPGAARRSIHSFLADRGWGGDSSDVALAAHEALVNARRHGGAAVRADIALEGSSLVVRVWDSGPGFDLRERVRSAPDPASERGRGLWLIDQVTTDCAVEREPDGAVVVMRFGGSG